MTIAEQIIAKLEASTSFRERRFRERGLLEMVLVKNGAGLFITSDKLPDIIKDYMSYERVWRDVLETKRKDLRGEDWDHGKALSQEFQLKELGREVGYHELTRARA